jgi:ribosomal protein L15
MWGERRGKGRGEGRKGGRGEVMEGVRFKRNLLNMFHRVVVGHHQ